MEEIKEGAKRAFIEKDDELLMGGNETFNVTKILTPQQMAMRQDKEKEAFTKMKDMLKDLT